MNNANDSKFLAYVLRHNPSKFGLVLEDGGWVDVEEVLKATNFSSNLLSEIVESDSKRRYSFSDDGFQIRANYGHSVDIAHDYLPVDPPDYLYHGTAERFLYSILTDGLTKQNRNFVHLTELLDVAYSVGKRHVKGYEPGVIAILSIDSKLMKERGFKFYNVNDVWLVDSVPAEMIIQISKKYR